MEVLVIAVLIGVIPGWIAQSKGHSFAKWWIYGSLLFIVALPMAITLKPKQNAPGFTKPGDLLDSARAQVGTGRRCPHCAEFIRSEALVCRYCGRDVRLEAASLSAAPEPGLRSAVPSEQGAQLSVEHGARSALLSGLSTSRCGHGINPGHRFCPECGEKIEGPTTCPSGHPVEPFDKFCPTCGSPIGGNG
jgi:uncharacterized OB-fold protein